MVPNVGDAPHFDYHLPLLSLPRVLGTREHTIPKRVPYLRVPEEALAQARDRLLQRCGESDGRLRVGLVWAGNPAHPDDANRSMKLEQFAPLLQVPGVQFVEPPAE